MEIEINVQHSLYISNVPFVGLFGHTRSYYIILNWEHPHFEPRTEHLKYIKNGQYSLIISNVPFVGLFGYTRSYLIILNWGHTHLWPRTEHLKYI
jgi:hypothetical protein